MGILSSNSPHLGAPLGSSTPVEAEEWMPTPSLRRPSDPLSIRTKILITSTLAALPAGYFVVGGLHRPNGVDVTLRPTINLPLSAPLPLREADAPAITPAGRTTKETEGRTAQPFAHWDDEKPLNAKPAKSVMAAAPPPQTLPESRKPLAAMGYDPLCLPSALAVRRNYPEARPSWTMKAAGHEGTRCWYAAARSAGPTVEAASSARADTDQTDIPSDARMPQTPERAKLPAPAAGGYDPTCLPSASVVRQSYPEARPSWTLRAPGHEGTKCWYAAMRTAADDHDTTE